MHPSNNPSHTKILSDWAKTGRNWCCHSYSYCVYTEYTMSFCLACKFVFAIFTYKRKFYPTGRPGIIWEFSQKNASCPCFHEKQISNAFFGKWNHGSLSHTMKNMGQKCKSQFLYCVGFLNKTNPGLRWHKICVQMLKVCPVMMQMYKMIQRFHGVIPKTSNWY